ncbi:alpha/beta fold hydrolase [Pseudonocardia kunmingensis]|uniref:Pimeloyl-ACP methyl ester carboxylesterase n=1 Tax=Pseudonocardia kunmingensis TaxID=630975 RepID=A0A543DPH0_9PSEU|nr:alpha/beta hydrolase [Pseudonocardia kunmingensis]TQM11183.1 pimeloyl-ACP methyl ester carboxylesterase [Pseudonocardia kunmingensis]
MPGPLQRRFTHAGVELAGDEFPADDARGVALLLHGGGQTRHSWKSAAATLARHEWTSITLDARGHGDSSWAPDGDYSMDALVADLVAITATTATAPVLIGASMGGLTSLVAVGEGRVRPAALVLVDIAPRIEPEGSARIGQFMRANPNGFASLEDVADVVAAYNPHRERPASLEGLKRNVRLGEDGRWHWHWDPAFLVQRAGDQENRLLGYDRLKDAARAVTVPTLLVRGKQSDVVSPEGAAELLELIPGSRFVDVHGTGHMVAGDDNDVFTREVLAFLDTLPGRPSAGRR